MGIGAQVYVRDIIAAVDVYCRAFGAEITFEMKDEKGRYAHCELSLDGKLFLAVSEAPENADTTQKKQWQTMAFNVYDLKTEERVRQAFDILKEGALVFDPPGPCPWNRCCTNLIDRFGVQWWIAV